MLFGQPASLRSLLGCLTLLAAGIWLFSRFSLPAYPAAPRIFGAGAGHSRDAGHKIAKVSMLYGKPNPCYEGAIESHRRHAELYGYPVYVLTHDISQGFWNKPTYIQSILTQELGKPAEQRAEWLMWFDADSIIINPKVPAEIFLPPADGSYDHIHFIGTKDEQGLNTGIFFLRVHQWSVRMLAKTVAMPLYRSELDLGRSADQNAMAILFNETEFRANVLYQPRIWYNTYEFKHGYEGSKGRLLVHFPGFEEDRWPHMEAWLKVVATQPEDWTQDLRETPYPTEIETFWSELGQARDVLRQGHEFLARHQQEQEAKQRQDEEAKKQRQQQQDQGKSETENATPPVEQPPEVVQAIQRLSFVIETETDRLEAVREARGALEGALARFAPPSQR